ncbi:MAG TPA: CoA pyrophosphatase [Saprospiraceae bacterium]|nr:CoA pyrophosphatase [Saprospiraceae bacterium]
MIPQLSRPPFINTLHAVLLDHKLPGSEAHQKMAHPIRKANLFPTDTPVRNAAVLMVLFEKHPEDFHLIFIRRTISKEGDKHSGQIAFPGGKAEDQDPDFMYTALREAQEETAIDLSQLDVLGALSPIYINVSNFLVHPFLAYSWQVPDLIRQETEIEEILELPLSAFLDISSVEETRIQISSGIILNHVPCFQVQGHIIWGATAMIMSEFLEVIRQP